jgi:hypothetical protein
VSPTSWTSVLAGAADSAGSSPSPTLTIITTLLAGGLLLACVAVYKARAEKGTVVASGAESAVVSMGRSLDVMEKRAQLAERRQATGRKREAQLEAQMEALRATSEALVNLCEATPGVAVTIQTTAESLFHLCETALAVHRADQSDTE